MDYEVEYEKLNALKRLKGNMALFGRSMFPTALRKDIPPFHSEIYKALGDDTMRRVLIAAPRGTAKSTTTSLVYPLWKVAFKPSAEDLFIVIISESQAQSINFLSRIKYHLTHSDKFINMFGDFGPNTAARWTNTDVVLANGARIIAVGTGQRVRGFIEGDTRPNLIIVDDYESELNANTPEARAKNKKWMTEAVIPSLSDDGKLAMIGTVISEDCFLYWAKDSDAWHTLWYAIEDEDGNSLWEDRFPKERIAQIKKEFDSIGNLNGFYQEYMNIAQSPDNAPFKPEWMKTHEYDFERIKGVGCLTRRAGQDTITIPVEVYCGVDPASSLSLRADYFVISVIGIDKNDNKYVIDFVRGKFPPSEQPDLIIETFKKYRPKRMKIETTGYQEALRDAVRKNMIEQNLYIPGLEKGVKPRNKKSERLISLVPMFAKGKFYFRPQDTAGQQEFMSYPKGKHDDIMDSIWTALDGAKPSRYEDIDDVDDPNDTKEQKSLDWMTM